MSDSIPKSTFADNPLDWLFGGTHKIGHSWVEVYLLRKHLAHL